MNVIRRFLLLLRHLTLLRTFSLFSAIMMILIAVGLSITIQHMIEGIALAQESMVARNQAEALLQEGMLSQNLTSDLTTDASRHLIDAFRNKNPLFSDNVRLKIWNRTGTILYSDDPAAIGRHFEMDDGLADVISGRASSAADISNLSDAENQTERGLKVSQLLEVYVPIKVQQHGHMQIVGAYEVYHSLDGLLQQEAMMRRVVWFTIGAGFLVLYISLFFIVRNASRRLVRQAAEKAVLLEERQEMYLTTLDAMARTIDARDAYTAGHSQRVATYGVAIGRQLNVGDHLLSVLQQGGVLHDIGKVGVPDAVLNKPGRLNPDETAEMQRHPTIGYELLRDMPFLAEELPLIRSHHERWDGRGYPDGLQGEQIPLIARILAVSDAFDAMTSDRPYRRALPLSVARTQMISGAGTQFWPPAVDALLVLLDTRQIVLPDLDLPTQRAV